MHEAIQNMLKKYELITLRDYENALKEMMQQIILLGLWRSDFYDKCAFYGGSALRIAYGLDRFSEDLDFTLLKKDEIKIDKYFSFIKEELKAFGFQIEIEKKEKTLESPIESAFVKANTYIQLLQIEPPEDIVRDIHQRKKLKIKLEIDINPPEKIEWENKYILEPIPFSIAVVKPSYMFAGKIHAILYRRWKNRVKGRDWYDLVWFISQKIPVNLKHLQSRIKQSEEFISGYFTTEEIRQQLIGTIDTIDIEQAKRDVLPFVKREDSVRVWSAEFFKTIFDQILFE